MFWLTRLSFANRGIAALASVAILMLGLFILPLLKQELLPPVEYPAISVVSVYPGAASAQVEQDVTNPLEQSILGMQDVQQVTSQSRKGASLITVLYNDGTDIDSARQKLAAQVSSVQPALPAGVSPQLQIFNPADLPIITLSVTSTQDEAGLGVALKQMVAPALQGIGGVSTVNVTGIRQQIVTVNLNVQRMREKGVSLPQIQQALASDNIVVPAGEVSTNGQTLAVRVGNTFGSLADLEAVIIASGSLGPASAAPSASASTPVRLSDVATVQEDLAPSSTLTRVNGQPGLGIAITKTPQGNTVAISQALRSLKPELEQRLGHGARITILDDQAPAIQSSITDLAHEGLLGAAFAILVILVFLLSVRSTLVIAISIPLSVVIALIALWTQGEALNIMTLSGLTIAVGRVVDDSIVVLENIYRHLRNGEAKGSATLSGVREVAGAVTASTLTTIAVFLPLAFLGGIVGSYTHPLALTVTLALLASLLVALTIIPVLAYWFLKAPASAASQYQTQQPTILERGYTPLIRWVTRHRVLTVLLAVLILAGSLALFPLLPTNAYGNTGESSFAFSLQLPPGASIEHSDAAARRIEEELASTAGIESYQVIVGTSNAAFFATMGTNVASFTVTVKSGVDGTSVEQAVRTWLKGVSGIGKVTFQDQLNNAIDVTVQAPDEQTLRQATQEVFNKLKQTPNAVDATSDQASLVPFINVQVNTDRAALHGLTALQVGQALQAIYTGVTVTHVTLNSVVQEVNLKLAAPTGTVQQMEDVQIPGPLGLVRLGDIATITQMAGPGNIPHLNGVRTATITLTAVGANVGGVTQDVQNRIASLTLPNGATASLGGNAAGAQAALQQLFLALLIAIPLVFIIMMAVFRSLVQALILLVAIPFAAVGAIVLAVITRTAIGISSLFGFLMLIGIVVTNAIVLIDRVNHLRATGMDARSAVIAGGAQRVRPILMTAVATILALLPMAVNAGGPGNGVISSSLAIVVMGGLASSTCLTLLFVPALYMIVEDIKGRVRKKPDMAEMPTGKQASVNV